jgi:hypothetical protein
MALKKGSNIDRGYATIVDEDGVNYRDIAETMTELGYPMNHSSARNYVLRIMRKFVIQVAIGYNVDLDEEQINEVAKSPQFQRGVADMLHDIETDRRDNEAAA